jgi:Protein of unknown function (DUF3489)
MPFTIDSDNAIMAHDGAATFPENVAATFATEKELLASIAEWPISRLVELWNGFAGVAPFGDLKPVKKFENKAKATRRIWEAIQKLGALAAPAPAKQAAVQSKPKKGTKAKAAKQARPAKPAGKVKAPREGTAKAKVIALLERRGGVTLQEIMTTTGWQAHYADVRIMPTCVGNPACGAVIAAMESA